MDILAAPQEDSPEDTLIGKEEIKLLQKQIDKHCSQFERRVLSLYLQGYDYHQIAKAMGKTPKSIDNALQRIKKKSTADRGGGISDVDEWAADMLGLLGVLMIWAVLLPENSAQWRIILFGKMNLPVRWLQTGGSLLIVGALFAIMEWATFYPQPPLVLLLLLLIAVFAFLFRGFPLSFTIMHTFFAVTVTEYFQILFRCFVPLGME